MTIPNVKKIRKRHDELMENEKNHEIMHVYSM